MATSVFLENSHIPSNPLALKKGGLRKGQRDSMNTDYGVGLELESED